MEFIIFANGMKINVSVSSIIQITNFKYSKKIKQINTQNNFDWLIIH